MAARPTSLLAVATPERHATEAALAAAAAGGNALDAALAAATTLTVTYPHNCGVGGDLFAVVRFPDGTAVSVNASGPAARGASAADQRTRGRQMPAWGPDTITVPGAVAGWGRLHALGGRLSWASAFRHARRHAHQGVPAARSLMQALRGAAPTIAADAGMSDVFAAALQGAAPLRQPALARTLDALAEHGWRELYEGDTGGRLAAFLGASGSLVDHDDLARFTVEETHPLTGRFRDIQLLTSPPNSSGVLLLQAFAVLQGDGASDWLGADAGRLATVLRTGADQRSAMLADPRSAQVRVGDWLGQERITALASAAPGLTRRRGAVIGAPPTGDTVAVVAADQDGLAVSLIQSLFSSFGSCMLDPDTGVLFHNRGAAFALEPGHPNELTGGKRPAHTLLPLVIERDGVLAGVLGTMGGNAHAQILVQVLLELLAGSDPDDAVSAPRWVVGGLDLGAADTVVTAETGIPPIARRSLAKAGFTVADVPWPSEAVGHAQAVWRRDGALLAGSDPRADGSGRVTATPADGTTRGDA